MQRHQLWSQALRTAGLATLIAALAPACASERSQVKAAPKTAAVADVYKQPAPPPEGSPTVIVADLEGGAEGIDAAEYTPFVRRGLAESRKAFVVLKSEQKSLLGACETAACLERVGKESAASRYLCTGKVSRLGDSWMVSMALIDVQRGTTLQRVMKRGGGDLDPLVSAAAKELALALP